MLGFGCGAQDLKGGGPLPKNALDQGAQEIEAVAHAGELFGADPGGLAVQAGNGNWLAEDGPRQELLVEGLGLFDLGLEGFAVGEVLEEFFKIFGAGNGFAVLEGGGGGH